MLRKLIIVTCLLPILVIVFIVITAFIFGESLYIDEYLILSTILASALIIAFSFKLKLIKFNFLNINLKEFLIALLLAAILFFIFYIEKICFGSYIKEPSSVLFSIMMIVLIPIVEEVINKKIVLDNLDKLKVNKFLIIGLTIFYFTVLHYPDILFVHFLVGLGTTLIYYKNRNILQVILIHAFYNFSIIFYNYL